MLIGLFGPPCSGVRTVARLLVEEHNFTALVIGGDEQENGGGVRTVEDALEIVSPQWQMHFVVYPITTAAQAALIRKRPYGLLIAVDAPLLTRFHRAGDGGGGLDRFVEADDGVNYSGGGLRAMANAADRVLMNCGSVEDLRNEVGRLNPVDAEHVRPGWDTYFMRLAFHASLRSNCMKRRVGAVLVHNNRVVATGYNGTPRGTSNCSEGGCPRCNGGAPGGQGLDHCFCMHAEENALLEAGRERGEGTIMYTTLFPCLNCAKKMVQVGVKKVVYAEMYVMDELSQSLLESVGVQVAQHSKQ